MKIISNVQDLKNILSIVKSGDSLGFVPTMGALHKGHLDLVSQSVAENEYTIVSIFVNPTQFNNATDLEKYPRDLKRDAELLQAVGCDFVFAPEVNDLYSHEDLNSTFEFDFEGLDKVMEGKFRPGHFNGVVQVVSKLFDLVEPDKAYFGEKDFQQLAIIKLMVKKMNFKVEIVDCPIVRENSGLAMSSRNERLSTDYRNIAANISRILFESRTFVGKLSPQALKSWVETKISEINGLDLEYFEISDIDTLLPVENWDKPAVGCIAVFCSEVRLIDNIRY